MTIGINQGYLLMATAISLGQIVLIPYSIVDSIVGGFAGTLIANRVWPQSLRNQILLGMAVGAFAIYLSFWATIALLGGRISNTNLILTLEDLVAYLGLVLYSLIGILFCKLAIRIHRSTQLMST